jgi:hypothetical protein
MSHGEDSLLNKPRQHASSGKQPLVVRSTDQDSQLEMLDRLMQLETSLASVKEGLKAIKSRGELRKLDARTLVALGAMALSITGYVIQDARNTSRQDTEIETAKARLAIVERVQAINTDGRIRMEVELQQLREGQAELKRLLEQHDSHSRGAVQQSQ